MQRQEGPAITATDQRGDGPDWLGTLRGGVGNPVGSLRGDKPVAELVRQAFADELAVRGLGASGHRRAMTPGWSWR